MYRTPLVHLCNQYFPQALTSEILLYWLHSKLFIDFCILRSSSIFLKMRAMFSTIFHQLFQHLPCQNQKGRTNNSQCWAKYGAALYLFSKPFQNLILYPIFCHNLYVLESKRLILLLNVFWNVNEHNEQLNEVLRSTYPLSSVNFKKLLSVNMQCQVLEEHVLLISINVLHWMHQYPCHEQFIKPSCYIFCMRKTMR